MIYRTLLLVALATPVLTAPALAQDDTEVDARAKELYKNGAILYEEGRYEAAIAAWQQAHEISDKPVLLFNIANAYERLGDYEAAIENLDAYRAFAKAEERDSLDRRLKSMEKRQAEAQAAKAVTPGTSPVATTTSTSTVAPGSGPSSRVVTGVALVGVGAAGLITGTVFGLRSNALTAELESNCLEGGLCPDSMQDSVAAQDRSALIADIGFVVGTAAAASGLVITLTGMNKDTSVSLAPAPGGAVLAARF